MRIESEDFIIAYEATKNDKVVGKLCFNCAVKAVINDNAKIRTEIIDYKYKKCKECEDYID